MEDFLELRNELFQKLLELPDQVCWGWRRVL